VVVAGELPREAHNAPLHLFSAQPTLIEFGGRAYQQRSERTSALLDQLFEGIRAEGFAMPYTMEDFLREYVKDRFPRLPKEEQEELLRRLPLETRLAGLSEDEIRQYLDRLSAQRPAPARKPRRKK
jgi:hypothetical protein